MSEERITRVSLKQARKMKSETDWARVDALTDEDIDRPTPSELSRDTRPLWQYLLHIVFHAAQQQSDAATLLSLAGHSPGDIGYGEWIRVLRANGFDVEDLIEIQASADAPETRFPWADKAWARRWPSEEIWKARKR